MKLCGFDVGLHQPIFLIAGTCVIESRQMAMDTAGTLIEITKALGIPFIYKSSFDKANRSSGTTYRGPGMEKGLEILADVKRTLGVPVLTDVHTIEELPKSCAVVDVHPDPRLSRAPDRFHRRLRPDGPARQHQEGPVPRAPRHEERHRQGPHRGTRQGPE